MACFHAAQAIIFERQGRLLKTHKGVHTEFHRVMKAEPGTDPELVTFLPRAYNFKAQTDYGFEADSQPPSAEQAKSALETATRFVDATETIAAKLPGP